MYFAYVQEMLKMSPDAGGLEYGAVALVDWSDHGSNFAFE